MIHIKLTFAIVHATNSRLVQLHYNKSSNLRITAINEVDGFSELYSSNDAS